MSLVFLGYTEIIENSGNRVEINLKKIFFNEHDAP